jgi:hypothetical protein
MTTHVHEPVLRSPGEIAEKARNIHPLQFTGRILFTLVAFLFTAIGWTVGAAWFGLVFSVLFVASRSFWAWQCIRIGFQLGARYKFVEKPRE